MEANVLIALDPTNVYVRMDGLVQIVRKRLKCARLQPARMMLAVSISSKTISVSARRVPMENNAK